MSISVCIPVILLDDISTLSRESRQELKANYALNIAHKLYELVRPPQIRQPNEPVFYTGIIIKHHTTDDVYLEFETTEESSVSVHADLSIVMDILGPYQQAGLVPLEQITDIYERLSQLKLQRLQTGQPQITRVIDYIPPYWMSQKKTREELEQEGAFSTDF